MSGGVWGKLVRGSLVGMAGAAATVSLAVLAGGTPAQAAGFGDPFLISGPATFTYGTKSSDVVARDDGSFVYVWVKEESSDLNYLEAVVVKPDGSMGPTQTLDSGSGNLSVADVLDDVSISTGSSGKVHAAWSKVHYVCTPVCSQTTSIHYVNLKPDGSADGTPVTVQTLATNHSSAGLALATAGSGRTGILYSDSDNLSTVTVLMAIAPGDSSPLSPFVLNESGWDGVQYLDIAGSSNGTLFPIWSGFPDGSPDPEAHGRLVKADGTITPERQFFVGNSSLDSIEARIDGNGRASAFAVDNEVNQLIRMRQLNPDGTLIGTGSTKVTLDAATDALPGRPYTAIAGDGTITATFTQPQAPSDNPSVWTRTISPTGALGAPVQFVPADADRILQNPSVGTAAEGSGFLTWWEEPLNPPDSQHYFYNGRAMAAGGLPTGSTKLLQTLQSSPFEYPYPRHTAFSAEANGAALWSVEFEDLDYADQLYTAIFDGSTPEAELWVPPAATTGQEIVMAVEASDNSALTYQWKVDGTALAETGPVIRHTFTTSGSSQVSVRVVDAYGNEATVSSSVTVSSPPEPPAPPIPPDTKITGKPAKKTKSKTATFKFISSLSGSKFECRLDKAGWSDCKSPKKLKKLKSGKHTFKVRAIKEDLIDNSPASFSWSVKKTKKE